MAGAYQFVIARRHVGQDAPPAKRVHPLKLAPDTLGQGLAGSTVKAVAAGDEVAFEPLAPSMHDHRPIAVDPFDRLDRRLPDDRQAALVGRVDQVARYLRLTIDGDLAAGEPGDVDPDHLAIVGEREPAVRQPFRIQPIVNAESVEQVGGRLLQDARTDALDHARLRLPLDDDAVDSLRAEQVAEQQSRRPRAYDPDLCPHRSCSSSWPSTR